MIRTDKHKALYCILVVVALLQGCGTLSGLGQDNSPLPPGEPIRETRKTLQDRQNMQQPAILALLERADKSEQGGNLDGAAANLERALRINPRSAHLWHRLANVRLRQHRLQQAANLALKSNSYSKQDKSLQAKNWRIIYSVRQRLGDMNGAQEALSKAKKLEN